RLSFPQHHVKGSYFGCGGPQIQLQTTIKTTSAKKAANPMANQGSEIRGKNVKLSKIMKKCKVVEKVKIT
uniref:Uncharacterized protein n=1 Tax=Romanomermis culicivorax TaxID=13658 RepID=A0A915IGE8_ROMCU